MFSKHWLETVSVWTNNNSRCFPVFLNSAQLMLKWTIVWISVWLAWMWQAESSTHVVKCPCCSCLVHQSWFVFCQLNQLKCRRLRNYYRFWHMFLVLHLHKCVLRVKKTVWLHVCMSIQMSMFGPPVCKPVTHFTPLQSNAHFPHGCGAHFTVRTFLYTLAPGAEGGTRWQ